MIEVKRKDGSITVSGHAHYAEIGKDIVCAAVSVLAQTLINSIEKLTTDKIGYRIASGSVIIEHKNLSEQAKLLIGSFFVGVQSIANSYPQHVCVLDETTKH